MVFGQLKQPLPVEAMLENLPDSNRKFSTRVLAAAGQNQVKFWVENNGMWRICNG